MNAMYKCGFWLPRGTDSNASSETIYVFYTNPGQQRIMNAFRITTLGLIAPSTPAYVTMTFVGCLG
jgi:hypothetical protein